MDAPLHARHGHQMMVIGQEGDMLQIYNPWGQTPWVSEDDFVNGHKASGCRMARRVRRPPARRPKK
ncbi:hypothetical protein ACFYYR_23225 [Streptomyces sp. NPDC001922]|uniref:hypothetical protein n=1 Tax=Streptomyces sp. NPDC001922 TaxID=3364624 RepID=UPI00367FC65F